MRSLHDLPTPAVLVDLDVLERNVQRMAAARAAARRAAAAAREDAQDRGHRAPAGGAPAPPGSRSRRRREAEVFADAGLRRPVRRLPGRGPGQGTAAAARSRERVRLAVGADSVEGARTLAEVFAGAGRTLERDAEGGRRLPPRRGRARSARSAVARADRGPARRCALRGVFTHAGHAYARGDAARASTRWRAHEGQTLARCAEALRAAGLAGRRGLGGLDADRAPRDGGHGRHRVPPGQLRLPRRVAGGARHLPARGLRADGGGHGGERARGRTGGGGRGQQDALQRPAAPAARAGTAVLLGHRSRLDAAERGARRHRGGSRASPSASASACASCPTTPAWSRTCTTGCGPCAATRSRTSCRWPRGAASSSQSDRGRPAAFHPFT